MRAHIRSMATTYLSLFLALFLFRMATDGVFDTWFIESVEDALWGGGIAMVAALRFGPNDERRQEGA